MSINHVKVTISLPSALLAEIDAEAAARVRSRSNFILSVLSQSIPKNRPEPGDGEQEANVS